jgi:hypothetical protein
MGKVVINSCFGSFGLSNEAMDRLVELGYELTPNPNYNPHEKSIFNYKYKVPWDIDRSDPTLIKVVEELGERANGDFANLEIVEVEWLYSITEYDGLESIETPDNIDWESA